ncbi:hypothetical protein Efla_004014 [Eimeria flavescens]
MNGLQRLAQPLPLLWFLMVPLLLLQLLPPAATASRLLGGKAAGSAGSKRTLGTTAFTRSWLIDSSSGSSSRESSTCIFSRGRFLLHPRLRVRRLSRGSGGSHLLELARQRLLLHREGDVEKYMNTPIMPFPAVGEVHSQKKRCKAPPPRALLSGPLALHRQTKMLLRRHRGTRNNRRVLLLRDRLTLLLQQQQELLCESTQPSRSLLRKLWDLDKPSQPRQQQADEHRLQQQHGTEEQQQENQKANGRLQRRLTRPLGSKFLFVCGVDLNAAATDLENLFQTITEHPVHARLRRNKGKCASMRMSLTLNCRRSCADLAAAEGAFDSESLLSDVLVDFATQCPAI